MCVCIYACASDLVHMCWSINSFPQEEGWGSVLSNILYFNAYGLQTSCKVRAYLNPGHPLTQQKWVIESGLSELLCVASWPPARGLGLQVDDAVAHVPAISFHSISPPLHQAPAFFPASLYASLLMGEVAERKGLV